MVFISYNSENEVFAELVKMKLEKENIQVWKDKNQISAGTEWKDEIDKGIQNCDIVIVLLNQLSAKSFYVTYEWAFALGKGKTIIPVLIEDCEIHPRIKGLQYIDFKNANKPWEKLVEEIKLITENNSILEKLNTEQFNLQGFLKGEWLQTYSHYSEPTMNGQEIVKFIKGNQYYIDNNWIFVLTDIDFDANLKELKWTKIRCGTNQKHAREILRIIDDNTITGTDDLGCAINYKRKNSK